MRIPLRVSLLATSSAQAMIVGLDPPAGAATCTVNNSNPSLLYTQSGNICVNFTGKNSFDTGLTMH
jgi:hypothetical protein